MSTPSWTSSSSRDERGAGLVPSVVGAAMFLALVLFGAQVLFGLYATSVITAVTFDAATEVADAPPERVAAATGAAESSARRRLGGPDRHLSFDWDVGPDAVRLTVRARRPTLLPRALVNGAGLGDIVRSVTVRSERVR